MNTYLLLRRGFVRSQRQIDVAWGLPGVEHTPRSQIFVIVDVLSFSSAVDAACSCGAKVYPFAWNDACPSAFASSVGAQVAVGRHEGDGPSHSTTPIVDEASRC
jgi:2-phosphosulfolactate phosphatase